jgi:hypothetical protein
MVGGTINEAIGLAFGNVTLLASLAAVSTLLLGYIRCELLERRLSTDFSLRKLESLELARALLLYRKASVRLQEIRLERARLGGSEWRGRRRRRIEFREKYASELQDLADFTKDLRSTIVRIGRRPLQRYRSWAQIMSLQVAFRRSIDAYFLTTTMLSAFFFMSQGARPDRSLKDVIDTFTQWKPFNGAPAASWLLIGTAIAVLPIAYVQHRLKLRKRHAGQIRSLEDLASGDADRICHLQADTAPDEEPATRLAAVDERSCFEVLGVSPSASIEDVKRAYKLLVRKTHPDRVQDMAPAIKQIAESETKKLNVAYTEALLQLQESTFGASSLEASEAT